MYILSLRQVVEEKEKDADEAMEKDTKGAAPGEDVAMAGVEESSKEEEAKDVLTWILTELLDKYLGQTKPSVRQVSTLVQLRNNKTVIF